MHFEIWLRGFAKNYLRSMSQSEKYHPHITLARPFNITSSETKIKKAVTNYCTGQQPIFFTVKEMRYFPQGIAYASVGDCDALRVFDSGLEQALAPHVEFAQKLADEKTFHATIKEPAAIEIPEIQQFMLRMTGIKDKRIWFSYDFVTQRVLEREQSLDDDLWKETVSGFLYENGLQTSEQGFIERS